MVSLAVQVLFKVNEVPCRVFLISIFHYPKRWIQREFAVIYIKT